MAKPTTSEKSARMGDEAVKVKTGKTWPQWFAALDKHGCKKMNHKEIVAVVDGEFGIGPWWQQMVTVAYEQERGLRVLHETTAGFQVSRSTTLDATAERLFRAWNDTKERKHWLADPGITIRTATVAKSMRITWIDGQTHVDVQFYPKGAGRCQVTVQHRKLPTAKEADRMKKYWGEQLAKLKERIEE